MVRGGLVPLVSVYPWYYCAMGREGKADSAVGCRVGLFTRVQ